MPTLTELPKERAQTVQAAEALVKVAKAVERLNRAEVDAVTIRSVVASLVGGAIRAMTPPHISFGEAAETGDEDEQGDSLPG